MSIVFAYKLTQRIWLGLVQRTPWDYDYRCFSTSWDSDGDYFLAGRRTLHHRWLLGLVQRGTWDYYTAASSTSWDHNWDYFLAASWYTHPLFAAISSICVLYGWIYAQRIEIEKNRRIEFELYERHTSAVCNGVQMMGFFFVYMSSATRL